MSVQVVRGLVEATEQAGVSRARFLRSAHLESRQLESDTAWISHAEIYRLCELALELTGDPALGLHWSERLSANTFNPLSHLVAHAPTLRQGLECLIQFHGLLSHGSSIFMAEHDGKVTLSCACFAGASLPMQRFASEMLVSGLCRTVWLFAPGARLERVCFEYGAPSYEPEYARVLEHPARFDQSFSGIVFDRSLMDAVSQHKDEDVHNALRVIAERRIARLTQREPFAMRVRDVLVQRGAHRVEMDAVARTLGMSTRSLRRRLVAEGKSYNEVVNEALAIVAKQLLWNKHLTIQEAAYEMGFADTSTFHRAFKRWTGMTPNTFREQQLAG